MSASPPPLSARNLGIHAGKRNLVDELSFSLNAGECVAVLGANGSGKTLLLETLAGLRRPAAGHVELAGRPLSALPRRQVAQTLALLLQERGPAMPERVDESVLSGRYAHVPPLRRETDTDRRHATAAMVAMAVADLGARDMTSLSGGERQRVSLARVVAQDTPIYLLDEPDNHLDLGHQRAVLDLFRTKAAAGAAVMASLHDINLAAGFADRFLLLFGDGDWVLGDAATTLTREQLQRLTGVALTA
ncbi:MAG: ABC transporter ATP-binding protein, partial [Pseudomonadota bacterium]